jgi:hypothetical protein
VVAPAVLPRGGIKTDREGDRPGEENDREIEDEGEEQAIADYVLHRQVMLEGPAEIALDEARKAVFAGPHADPDRVLLEEGLVEPVLLAQELRLFHRRLVALALQLGDLVGEEVARRQLDDDEGDEADHDERRDHQQHSPQRIAQHYRNQNVSGR